MDAQQVFTAGQQGLYMLLMVSAPILLTVLVVGLVVSVFQAATQINEATLSFVPKIIGAVAVLVPLGILLVQRLLRRTLAISAPAIAAIGAALTIVAALAWDLDDLLVPASVTLVLNLALVIGFVVVRSKLRGILRGGGAPTE